MNGTVNDSVEQRRRSVSAFNATMVKIWREQMVLLGVIDTGALYRSTVGVSLTADGKFIDITLSQALTAKRLRSGTEKEPVGGSRASISPR